MPLASIPTTTPAENGQHILRHALGHLPWYTYAVVAAAVVIPATISLVTGLVRRRAR